MDLSKWAFEKIGKTGDGVMGIYYRVVDCPGEAKWLCQMHNMADV